MPPSMYSRNNAAGLGIDMESPDGGLQSRPYPSNAEVLSRSAGHRLKRTLTGPREPMRRTGSFGVRGGFVPPSAPPPSMVGEPPAETMTMRSRQAMEGLERAEMGDGMVAFDMEGGSMREGSRFASNFTTPRGGTMPMRRSTAPTSIRREHSRLQLPRDGTILNFGQSPARNAAELKSLLGDSNSRLKSGAAVPPTAAQKALDKKTRKEQALMFEQARSRARVEVDLILQSDVFVQGGYVRGEIKVRVRKGRKKESPVLLAEGKIRIVGFETLPNDDERHVFYQVAAPFTSITNNSRVLFDAEPDFEGFAQAAQGIHVLPFVLQLPSDDTSGAAKGALSMTSGISVRYIVMVSIKVLDPSTSKRSLAHFYRNCEVWPHLDPTTILRPAPRPLSASTAKNISLLGGNNAATKVKLSAQLPRLHWAAGTRCPVLLHIENGSKKTIRSIVLTLVRTTTLFRPKPMLDADGDRDPDSCQTATTHKVMAEAFLEMSASVVKGHASAKGWWTGVGPRADVEFTQYIIIPPEILSVTRSRLVEVEYSIRVTASAGSLSSDISVTLPIRVFNFLSIDPPVTLGVGASAQNFPPPCFTVPGSGANANADTLSAASASSQTVGTNGGDSFAASTSHVSSLHVMNPDPESDGALSSRPPLHPGESEVSMSMYSAESASDSEMRAMDSARALSGVLELDEGAGSDDEVEAVMRSVRHEDDSIDEDVPLVNIHGAGAHHAPNGHAMAQRAMAGVGTGARMSGFQRRMEEERRKRGWGRGARGDVYRSGAEGEQSEGFDAEGEDEGDEEEITETPRMQQRHHDAVSHPRPHDTHHVYVTTGRTLTTRASRELPRPPNVPNGNGSGFRHGQNGAPYHDRTTGSAIKMQPSGTGTGLGLAYLDSSASEPEMEVPLVRTSKHPSHHSHTHSRSHPHNQHYAHVSPLHIVPSRSHPHARSPNHTFIPQPQSQHHNHNTQGQSQGQPPLPVPPPSGNVPSITVSHPSRTHISSHGHSYPIHELSASSDSESDADLMKMSILRPPVRPAQPIRMPMSDDSANTSSDGADAGAGAGGAEGAGVRGRIKALEERVRNARLSGEGYY